MLLVLLLASLASTSSAALFGWGSSDEAKSMARRDVKIVCYYTNWAQYRPKPGSYTPDNLDAKLCTHVIYAFAKIDENYELKAFEWNDESTEWAVGMYQKVANKKKENPGLKVMLAVGGWNHGSMPFSNMVTDEKRRRNFIAKTIEFLKQNNFDGLDLDWEYPAHRDTEDRPDDKIYFTILCKELYADFRRQGLLLSAAVAAGSKIIDTAYELSEIHKYLDFINLMAYDLHGAWENVTGHNAPLYPHLYDRDKTFNVDWAVRKWISRVPAEKLVLGLSAYGRSFAVKAGFESCPSIDTPASAAGTAGTYSRENGFLTYYEVCDKILNNKWKYIWDEQQKVPYAYSSELDSPEKQTEWVGFDDVRSIEQKVKYIKDMQLGGAMLWSLDMDDFDGSFCQQGKYPILRTINQLLNPKPSSKDLPNPSLLYGTNNSRPVTAASRIYPMEDVIFSNGKYFDKVNVFGLMQNDVDQIYKFCQCKNGTHKVFLSEQTFKSDNFIFIIDCNMKRVYHDKQGKSRNSDNTDVLTIGVNDNDNTTGGNVHEKNKSIWSIFGISSSSINSFSVDPFAMTICTLLSFILTVF